MDICTFWYGNKLRVIDDICLRSMVLATQNTNQKVKLYSYEKIKVPEGVICCDAFEILDKDIIKRINPYFPNLEKYNDISIVQFSDLFRIMLMQKQKGLWLDTDLYLYKSFIPEKNKIWLARENYNRLGVSVMYIPRNNPIIEEFSNYINGIDILPSWLGFKRRFVKPLLLKMQNKCIIPASVGTTVFGNDGVSRLAKKYRLFKQAKEKQSFYYWVANKSANIYDSKYGLEPLQHKEFKGFHIHRKKCSSEFPIKGSFYFWAVKRVADFYDIKMQRLFEC